MTTLILASKADSASLTLHQAVIEAHSWESAPSPLGELLINTEIDAHMLLVDKIHVRSDNMGTMHMESINKNIDDIIVLSKHVSSSEVPAMTVHPIGVLTGQEMGEDGRSGGVYGTLVPPNPRMASFLRAIVLKGAVEPNLSKFDLTLEATHHGPVMSLPTMYVEIGSSEKEWADSHLASIWAEIIIENLSSKALDSNKRWMLCIGGGHYAPRHRDILIRSKELVGHILPSYSLPDVNEEATLHNFEKVLRASILSMRTARPKAQVIAHIDRKSMNSDLRKYIIAKLGTFDVDVFRGKQLLTIE
ncbi:MAG: D-aminoacyl-tRNA deacylase [Candidatus Thalassarchaeaceae archaeon]